jgi:hypothetical protein
MTASNIRVSGCFRRKYRNVCRYSWVDSNHRVRGSLRHQFNSPWYVAAIDGVPPDAVLHDEDTMRAPGPRSDPAPSRDPGSCVDRPPLLRNRRWCVFGLGLLVSRRPLARENFCPWSAPTALLGRSKYQKFLILLARPKRFELPTPRFVVWCTRRAEYGGVSRCALAIVRIVSAKSVGRPPDEYGLLPPQEVRGGRARRSQQRRASCAP